jgi:hypothetical protein
MPHPVVQEIVACLDEDLTEAWAERAAILEFDAGFARDHAEAIALLLVLTQFPHRMALALDSRLRSGGHLI